MTTGCLNLLLDVPFNGTVDHAPVVTGMAPDPNVGRIQANLGTNCAPAATFFPQSVDDPDGDELTVRWTLLLPEDPQGNGSIHTIARTITEFTIEKLPAPLENKNYDFPPFELDADTIVNSGIVTPPELSEQVTNTELANQGQVLELRISDGGFKAGTNEPAIPGTTVILFSWPIQLLDTPCGT